MNKPQEGTTILKPYNMKFKLLFLSFLSVLTFIPSHADKVHNTFWECKFGMPSVSVKETLTAAKMNPIEGEDGNIFIKNVPLDDATFSLVCLLMSPVDGSFFKLIGTNSFETKEAADSCYNKVLAHFREIYPNLQIIRRPDNAIKRCTYPDDENVVTLGLYKKKDETGKNVFYVNINYWNRYASKKIREAQ